uniref:Uncharacterized protein n=1 Tax=Anguilla anguilla TaxID=7936 RepID=A0A0E9T1B2_ANGAN
MWLIAWLANKQHLQLLNGPINEEILGGFNQKCCPRSQTFAL